jgi:hypothetical protein
MHILAPRVRRWVPVLVQVPVVPVVAPVQVRVQVVEARLNVRRV